MMRRTFFLLLCSLACTLPMLLRAQGQPTFDPAYQFVQSGNLVQDKNFYLLTLFEQEPVLHKALSNNKALQQYSREHQQRVKQLTDSCTSAACYANALLYDTEQIKTISQALQTLYTQQSAFRETLQQHLRPSGVFMRYASMPEEEMLIMRWREEALGLNYILTAYTKNIGLRYPRIDSAAYDVRSAAYTAAVQHLWSGYKQQDAAGLFFSPALRFAMDLLQLNGKDHAARHEPMSATNQAPISRVSSIQWNEFPYSVILVLGAGPDDDQPISFMNKQRCRTGAELFKQHKAPFLIVSGGYVHPFGTKYSEAIEMKKFLADSCDIPANAIIVEPHARHTTTNMRNANRILLRNGFPADKKVLVTSSKAHLIYASSVFFEKVCIKDMGYLPYRKMRTLNDESIEYLPSEESLHEDPLDPLDP
ncbi:YdcF family protein [Chitinophaga agrisoli]|uniref:YdcF family protein n=1 Tax=Chitinophaga agrisoli TaxID=2607653 RepID=A0A5B2VY33_9BACT|nr:YdcF family protein [Chitinophaga agrisoli]KAA2243157.1 YdcF family protein [Chitinophaga agrisoli]